MTAHHDAVSAHVAGNMKANDTYGNTMLVRMNEALSALTAQVPGLASRKPEGVRSRFPLLIVEDTAVAIYPWRFGDAPQVRHEDGELRRPVSNLRAAAFSLAAAAGSVQPSFEEVDAPIAELEAQWAEDAEIHEELAKMGSVVVVGISSGPDGIFELGWGDVELVDRDTGEVRWLHWETLPTSLGAAAAAPRTVLRDVVQERPKFDAIPFDDSLDLLARRDDAPSSEQLAPERDTGTAESTDD
ncbi:hypothetical protein [Cellulomonas algicola]|uniref:hypothetical protein n=1 Tax=Cellulomonas algicola TaxID=2071633 RepID=UPI000F55D5BC|nr:hypothetical protein [Cellulomonas algicola]